MRLPRRIGLYLRITAIVIGLVVVVTVVGPPFWRIVYPLPYRAVIEKHALANSLDPFLVAAVIRVESGFRPAATSPRGARGLMQILPSTGAWIASQMGLPDYNENRLYEPEYNVMMGCWYLRNLNVQFKGHLTVALAAYNGGRGNVANWLTQGIWSGDTVDIGQIPFPETRGYVWKVLRTYAVYTELYAPRPLRKSVEPLAKPVSQISTINLASELNDYLSLQLAKFMPFVQHSCELSITLFTHQPEEVVLHQSTALIVYNIVAVPSGINAKVSTEPSVRKSCESVL